MGYVYLFVLPFVIGYLLAKFIGVWGALLAPIALLVAMFVAAYFTSTNVISGQFAQMVEGAMILSPYLVIILTPIYFVGTLIGLFARRRSNNKTTPQPKKESLTAPAYNATEQIHTGTQLSCKTNFSSITLIILALTFVFVLMGLAYDNKRASLEKDLLTYLLNSKQVLDITGQIKNRKDVHPIFIVGKEPQLTPHHTVYVFYVQGERGNFTIGINVDGSALSPNFSLNGIREGTPQVGEFQ